MAIKELILDDSILDFDKWLTPKILDEMTALIFGVDSHPETTKSTRNRYEMKSLPNDGLEPLRNLHID